MPKTKKFLKLMKAVKESYIGKPVPPKYQKKYGKVYDPEEAERIAFAIAKKRGWKI